MKHILTIGRGLHCDIVLHDATDVVSREHATLELDKKSGKYYLVDTSRNGTYVNGMRIIPNQRVLVSRGDAITFAHVQALDWSRVPKPSPLKSYLLYAAIAVGVAVIGVLGYTLLADDGRIEVYGLQMNESLYADDFSYDDGADLEDEQEPNEGENAQSDDAEKDKAEKPANKPAQKSEKPAPKPKSTPSPDSAKKPEAKPADVENKVAEQPKTTPADHGVSAKEERKARRAAKAQERAAASKKVYDAIY